MYGENDGSVRNNASGSDVERGDLGFISKPKPRDSHGSLPVRHIFT